MSKTVNLLALLTLTDAMDLEATVVEHDGTPQDILHQIPNSGLQEEETLITSLHM